MGRLYEIVYADPPWRYGFARTKKKGIEWQYPTMATPDVCEYLKVTGIHTSSTSVLFLWATSPKLVEALQVMKAWDYTYVSQIIWDKDRVGMGYWSRVRHEILLIGTRGKFSAPEPQCRPPSVICIPRGRHSAKPVEFREWIQKTFPGHAAIELFARWDGDDYWDIGPKVQDEDE